MKTSIHLEVNDLFALADRFADSHGTCLLYSGGTLDSAKQSFLALFPSEHISVVERTLTYQKGSDKQEFISQNPWEGLQTHFFDHLDSMAFGWFGYGMAGHADPDCPLPYRSTSLPDAYWQKCAVVICYEHNSKMASVTVDLSAKKSVDSETAAWIDKFATLQIFEKSICEEPSTAHSPSHSSQNKTDHLEKIAEIQELIREGEVYQVNLSQEFRFTSNKRPFSLFRQIAEENPAPFSAYFCYEQSAIVSSSPERFLQKKGNVLETRPIKGTIPRGKTAKEDALLKEKLLSSPKERAELLMITDLMRNDLGKVSLPGTVETLEIWRCEAYTNVFHLISVIRSIVKQNLKPLEIVRSCFPGGSITGCPKLRAMEVIDQLEKRARGIYTGSIGYFSADGDFDLNIAIRTLVAENNEFSLQLGGGIVIDSNPEQEYQEILHKGNSFFKYLQIQDDIYAKH